MEQLLHGTLINVTIDEIDRLKISGGLFCEDVGLLEKGKILLAQLTRLVLCQSVPALCNLNLLVQEAAASWFQLCLDIKCRALLKKLLKKKEQKEICNEKTEKIEIDLNEIFSLTTKKGIMLLPISVNLSNEQVIT
ncbi:uncharacterized protein LOC128042363 [Gossypium raimondii]|uniref:uncharacterized protein LOC128042363 n=1 Tax=Gossypium raimondii TaxID=29730 RepID=UPI00227A19C0|nr:uncharacterized protein LOC128042363 [Gossypium raimondii]